MGIAQKIKAWVKPAPTLVTVGVREDVANTLRRVWPRYLGQFTQEMTDTQIIDLWAFCYQMVTKEPRFLSNPTAQQRHRLALLWFIIGARRYIRFQRKHNPTYIPYIHPTPEGLKPRSSVS